MKFIKCFFLVCVIWSILNCSCYVEAAVNENEISPFFTMISKATARLFNSDGTLTLQTEVTAKKTCDMSIVMNLQRKSGSTWTTVKTWSVSEKNVNVLKLKKTYSVPKGTYILSATVSAGGEKATVTSETRTY